MPRFAIIDPKAKTIKAHNASDFKDAIAAAGLKLGELDFGTIGHNNRGDSLSIIVYEFSLIKGDPKAYFAFDESLFNGNAVLFQADSDGKTIDISEKLIEHLSSECPHVCWFDSIDEVEAAISAGRISRPQHAINGTVFWSWNQTKEN